MTIKTRILLIFLCGGLFGGLRFISTYQTYTDMSIFPTLTAVAMRKAIRWLVNTRPFGETKTFLLAVYPSEEPISHGVGHLLGEEVYRHYKNRAFSLCDPLFNYGCYHGVVDMAIRMAGPDERLVFELKKSCDEYLTDAGPCIHPLGHASAIVSSYDVVKAFALCDQMYTDSKVAFSCWNGAMMEYINRSAPNAPQVDYGHADDPYFPCNTFPKKYESSCVSMHTSYLKTIWNEDFGRVIRYCQTYASLDTRTHCVDAIGSIIGQKFFNDPTQAITSCKSAGRDIAWCLNGVNVPYLAAHKLQDARIVCAALSERLDREACETQILRTSKPLNSRM